MKIAWHKIAALPADGIIYTGSPEMGTLRVCHVPARKFTCEHLLAETPAGLYRRLPVIHKDKPSSWGHAHQLVDGTMEYQAGGK